ncbi:MAG: BTAD domain-containing putative transcriptional regulator [Intestinibacillus sp.]
MFHNCSITRRLGDREWTISDQDNSSKKMWLLLEYLLWNYKKPVPRDVLLDLLWGDEKASDPANSLKGLLFRVRNLLGEDGLGFDNSKQVILYQNGSYVWNEGILFELDTELFEKHCAAADAMPDNPDVALAHMLDAIALYTGDFLSQSAGNRWITPLSVYYHSKFLKLCAAAVELLRQDGRHQDIIQLCQRSIVLEPYDETLHRSLIRALADTGAMHSAMQHYKYTTELFMNQFGVSPSSEMTELYRELNKSIQGAEQDLQTVRNDLQESELTRGPYFCGYVAFKEIYHLSARSAARSGEVVQLAMLTVQSQNGQPLTQKQVLAAMQQLHDMIASTLRLGDVITQYSPSQYLIMLPSASYENAKKVMIRLLDKFLQLHTKLHYNVHYSLLPLLPVMQTSTVL